MNKSLKEFKKELGEIVKISTTNNLKIKWSVGEKCEYPYDCLVIFNKVKEVNIYWNDDEQKWGIDICTEEKILKSIRVKESDIKKEALRYIRKTFSLKG